MPTNIILDTNILLYDPRAIFHFDGDRVIIPIEVVEEIDRFKYDASESGRNSRLAAHLIDGLRTRGNLGEGVLLDNGSTLRVVHEASSSKADIDARTADSILRVALRLRRETRDETVVISKNVNLRVKADALGVAARDYEMDRVPDIEWYYGWHEVETDYAAVAALENGLSTTLPQLATCPNEYVFLRDREDGKHARAGRVDTDGSTIHPLLDSTRTVCGIRGLNLQQTFTIDALLDESLSLITLSGKAGTGKTLLAIAAGLHQVFARDRYHRLIVFRPTMPVSRDLGYLPGDLEEKMRPWMQPVYDALELIRHEDRKCPARTLPADVMDCDEISIEPLTYIRGRSIPNQYIIIDEAQNLTPLEVKTVITRVGAGSKIVFTGDPHQIDNPYVDAHSNGLTSLINKFRESVLSAHITLVKGERSQLAETAANLL